MSPDGVNERDVNLAQRLAAAKPSVYLVMQNGIVAKPDHRVAWVALRERPPDDYVTRLNGVHINLIEAVGSDVLQIQVFAAHPPTIGSLKVWQVDSTKVIGIAKERVTVHFAMHKPAAKQMRYL